MRYPLNSSISTSPSSGRLKTLRRLNKISEKSKKDKIVNNVVLQILQITHLPGRLERPEYECRPPCSTPQKQKVTEHVSCEGYSEVSGQWACEGRECDSRHGCCRSCRVAHTQHVDVFMYSTCVESIIFRIKSLRRIQCTGKRTYSTLPILHFL